MGRLRDMLSPIINELDTVDDYLDDPTSPAREQLIAQVRKMAQWVLDRDHDAVGAMLDMAREQALPLLGKSK